MERVLPYWSWEVFFNGPQEGGLVVGHRLRDFEQLGRQVLGAAKCDPQFSGPQRNADGKILKEALANIRRSRPPSAPGAR